jgi:hypothetical protein
MDELRISCHIDDLFFDKNKEAKFEDGESVWDFAEYLKELIDVSAEEFINDNLE